MKAYLAGQTATWKTDNIDTTVLNYITNHVGQNETQIATGTSLTVDQVMWAIDILVKDGKICIVPETWSDVQGKNSNSHGRG